MAPTKLISTSVGFQDSKGNLVASGLLSLTLSQNAMVTATNGQVTTEPIYFPLDANAKITSSAIWFNDELTPAGTTYKAVLYASNGCRIIQDFGFWSITGASADLSTMVPTSIGGPSAAGVVLLNPVNTQTIAQPSGTNLAVNNLEGIRFADQFTGSDLGAKINAAITDLPAAGGIVIVPNLSAGTTWTTTVSLSKPVLLRFDQGVFTFSGTGNAFSGNAIRGIILEGSGRRGDDTGNSGTTISVSNTAANGISATTCNGITVRDMNIFGPSSGTGKGIINSSGRATYSNLNISSFGSDGWTNDGSAVNSNTVLVSKVRSSGNGGNGFVAKGSNGQLVTFLATDGSGNTGDGYNIANQLNVFIGTNGDGNVSGKDYHFVSGGTNNTGFIFSNATSAGIVFDSGANNNSFTQTGTPASAVVSDSGSGNMVYNTNSVTWFGNTLSPVFASGNATLTLGLNSGNGSGIKNGVLSFEDNGTPEWNLVKSTSNNFEIDEVPASLVRFQLAAANLTRIESGNGAFAVRINDVSNSGTGGLQIYSGGASPIQACAIDSAGQITHNQTANGATWKYGSNSELLTLSTGGTTTDTTGSLLPANSIIEAVVAIVTTTITVATDWKLGDPTTAGRFSAADSTMTAGERVVGTVQADQTGAAGPRQVAAAKVRVTTTGTPGAGAIRITVFYRQFVAPTS